MALYDYLYVDLPKVISLYSQITGGVVEYRESMQESSSSADNKRNYDFKVFRHDAGGSENNKDASKKMIKPHHSLLLELESELAAKGYLLDLTVQDKPPSLRDPQLRRLLSSSLCIKVRGRSVIEDYERLKGISEVFPDIIKLINRSVESNFKESQAYKELQNQIKDIEAQVRGEKDRQVRATKEAQLKALKLRFQKWLPSVLLGQWISGYSMD